MKRFVPFALFASLFICAAAAAQDAEDVLRVKATCEELRDAQADARQQKIESLIKEGSKYLPVVNTVLQEEDPELERKIGELIKQLGDPEWSKRVEAHRELARIGMRALAQVLEGRKNKDREIAYRCTEIEKVIRLSMQDELIKRRRQFTALLVVVRAFADKSSLRCLHKLAIDDDVEIRRAAVEAVAAIADPSSIDLLFKTLDSPDFRMKCLAMTALGKINDPRALEAIAKVIDDPTKNLYLRRTAAIAMKRNNYKKAIGQIINALEDDSYAMRYVAFDALQTLADAGDTFGYNFSGDDAASKTARHQAALKWRDWWEKNRDRLLATPPAGGGETPPAPPAAP
jgi:HEAT repeat protein